MPLAVTGATSVEQCSIWQNCMLTRDKVVFIGDLDDLIFETVQRP
jgi:hypothetical protein